MRAARIVAIETEADPSEGRYIDAGGRSGPPLTSSASATHVDKVLTEQGAGNGFTVPAHVEVSLSDWSAVLTAC